MGSVIDSDALLRAAYYVTLGACGCTLLLILTIAWLRLSRQLRLRRQAARAADWEPLIALCALEPPAAQPRVKRRHRGAFFELWNHFYDLQRGEGHNHLRQLAGDPRLRAYVSHALRWGGLRSQIIAATTAGHLADPASMPALKPLVHHDSPTLSLAAAKSLMEIDPAANLPWLFPLIAQRVDWPISSVATTLRDLGVGVFAPPLAQAVRDTAETPHESQQLARLLRLTEIARQTHIMPAIRALFERGDALNAEVLAACLRLIVSPDDAHWARRHLAHAQWFVSVCAANALRRAGDSSDSTALIALLGDPHWWVRYRAAQALAALPGVSTALLEPLCEQLTDAFARDMLRCVLAENALR